MVIMKEGETIDDAARKNWGESWRIPSPDDIQELIDNTDNAWTDDYNSTGKAGYVFTSTTDATKSIFLPAAGCRLGSSLYDAGSHGYYWSSSLSESYSDFAQELGFHSGTVYVSHEGRICGQSLRPVAP